MLLQGYNLIVLSDWQIIGAAVLTCACEHIFKRNPRNWFPQFWSTQKLAPKSVVQTDSGGEGIE